MSILCKISQYASNDKIYDKFNDVVDSIHVANNGYYVKFAKVVITIPPHVVSLSVGSAESPLMFFFFI